MSTQVSRRPFDRVPKEIWAIITHRAASSLKNDVTRFQFPLKVAQLVSRRWREATITNPLLWTTIVLDQHSPANAVSQYLLRSAQLPLHIILYGISPILEAVLCFHVQRCVWLETKSLQAGSQARLLSLCTTLKHLSCEIAEDPMDLVAYSRRSITHLDLIVSSPRWDFDLRMLQFAGLTDLVIEVHEDGGSVSVDLVLGCISSAYRLKRLVVSGLLLEIDEDDNVEQLARSKAVTAKHLNKMILVDLYAEELHFLLRAIKAPELRQLEVGIAGGPDTEGWNVDANVKFHYPKLEQIHICRVDENSISLLRHSPSTPLLGLAGYTSYNPMALMLEPLLGDDRGSTRILKTRSLNMSAIVHIAKTWLRGLEKILIHAADIKKFGATPFSADGIAFGELQQVYRIESWGEDEGSDWHLETSAMRSRRIFEALLKEKLGIA
ncbi:hypothetical protein FRC02_004899 [Tulasnella sp. 418]|nr:hypothetical protein FRC02_004899 [Tulasnella sp. 418]